MLIYIAVFEVFEPSLFLNIFPQSQNTKANVHTVEQTIKKKKKTKMVYLFSWTHVII